MLGRYCVYIYNIFIKTCLPQSICISWFVSHWFSLTWNTSQLLDEHSSGQSAAQFLTFRYPFTVLTRRVLETYHEWMICSKRFIPFKSYNHLIIDTNKLLKHIVLITIQESSGLQCRKYSFPFNLNVFLPLDVLLVNSYFPNLSKWFALAAPVPLSTIVEQHVTK